MSLVGWVDIGKELNGIPLEGWINGSGDVLVMVMEFFAVFVKSHDLFLSLKMDKTYTSTYIYHCTATITIRNGLNVFNLNVSRNPILDQRRKNE